MRNRITEGTPVDQLLRRYPVSNRFFLERGWRCLQCGEPFWGTVKEFLEENGVTSKAEVSDILSRLNRYVADHESDADASSS